MPKVVLSTLIGLAILDFIVTALIPCVREIPPVAANRIVINGYVDRIINFLYSQEKANIVIVGSSLAVSPAKECDRVYANVELVNTVRGNEDYALNHPRCLHFERLLEQVSGQEFVVNNFAVPGSMVSDFRLVLEKILSFDKQPDLVICMIAPRDFVDNLNTDPDKTHCADGLRNCRAPQQMVTLQTTSDPLGLFSSSIYYLSPVRQLKEHWLFLREQLMSYRTELTEIFKRNRDPHITQVSEISYHSTHPKYCLPDRNEFPDLQSYNARYNPPNYELLKSQSREFDRMLSQASQNDVPLVLVEMPLTDKNLAILSPKLYAAYSKHVEDAAHQYGVPIIKASELATFNNEDFLDSAHLNDRGGHKLYQHLAQAIEQNHQLAESLEPIQRNF